MTKLPRLTPEEAEKLLFQADFRLERSSGSHRIYKKGKKLFVLPFHKGKTLHPKIVKELFKILQEEN